MRPEALYVAIGASVKFCVLKVRNLSGRPRRLSATSYVELVMGEMRSKTAMHIITEIDPRSEALYARNPYNTEFQGRIVFMDVNDSSRSVTGDRTEFLGRNGSAAALPRCTGRRSQEVFTFGAGRDLDDARNLVQRFRGSEPARGSPEDVWRYWNRILGVIYIETPEKSIDILINGWPLARLSRAASGRGQDIISPAAPSVLATSFRTSWPFFMRNRGWHQSSGRGVRTRISDDCLWLPMATCRYIAVTGEGKILDESTNFIEG
jgi:cyclic beta-1,2-glucan synthetase